MSFVSRARRVCSVGLLLSLLSFSCGGDERGQPETGPNGVDPDESFAHDLHEGWFSGAPLPTSRTEVSAAALGSDVVVVGGFTEDGSTSDAVEIYDTREDSWRTGPSLPAPSHHTAAASAGGRVYVIGGYRADGAASASVWSLGEGDTAWRTEPDLPTPRGALAAASVGDTVHAVGGAGGFGGSTQLSDAHEAFDTRSGRWSSLPRLPDPRDHLAAAEAGGSLYVIGGRKLSLTSNTARVDVYSPASETWSLAPEMPTARGGLAAASTGEFVLVFGGEEPASTFEEVEVFDVRTAAWSSLPPLPTPRHGLGAAMVGITVYVIGGGPTPGLSVSDATEILQGS